MKVFFLLLITCSMVFAHNDDHQFRVYTGQTNSKPRGNSYSIVVDAGKDGAIVAGSEGYFLNTMGFRRPGIVEPIDGQSWILNGRFAKVTFGDESASYRTIAGHLIELPRDKMAEAAFPNLGEYKKKYQLGEYAPKPYYLPADGIEMNAVDVPGVGELVYLKSGAYVVAYLKTAETFKRLPLGSDQDRFDILSKSGSNALALFGTLLRLEHVEVKEGLYVFFSRHGVHSLMAQGSQFKSTPLQPKFERSIEAAHHYQIKHSCMGVLD